MPFLLALASSVLYGIADFSGGIAARRGPVVTVTAWFQVIGVLPLVAWALLAPGVTRGADLAWASASGLAGGLGVTLLYRVLASGNVSTGAPLVAMIALTVPVAVGLASGERPGVLPLTGIVLGALAVMLISAHEPPRAAPAVANAASGAPRAAAVSTPHAPTALLPAFASGILVGLFLVCLGRVQPGSSGWPLVAGRASATLCLWTMVAGTRSPARAPRAAHAPILAAALTDVSANVLYLLAVQRAPLSLVATLVSLAPATTVVLAQLVLRERLAPRQRWGVVFALAAVWMLSQGTSN